MVDARVQTNLIEQDNACISCSVLQLRGLLGQKINGAHRESSAFIAGEIYEAVTKDFLCFIHSSATEGWKGAGNKLSPTVTESCSAHTVQLDSPNDQVRFVD